MLKQRPEEIEVKREFVDLLEKFGSFNYTKKKIKELDADARLFIKRLGDNPLLIQLLDKLIEIVDDYDVPGPNRGLEI